MALRHIDPTLALRVGRNLTFVYRLLLEGRTRGQQVATAEKELANLLGDGMPCDTILSTSKNPSTERWLVELAFSAAVVRFNRSNGGKPSAGDIAALDGWLDLIEEMEGIATDGKPAEAGKDTAKPKRRGGKPANVGEGSRQAAFLGLLNIYTNGVTDERISKAAIVLQSKLTVDQKLWEIDSLMPFPADATASALGKGLGVTKQAIQKTSWYLQNRKGAREKETGRRYEKHRERETQRKPESVGEDGE